MAELLAICSGTGTDVAVQIEWGAMRMALIDRCGQMVWAEKSQRVAKDVEVKALRLVRD